MKRMFTLTIAALALGLSTNSTTFADDAATSAELAKLKGVWRVVFVEANGEAVPRDRFEAIDVVIEGDRHTVRRGDQVLVHDVTFRIDPTANPRTTTDTLHGGENEGKQIHGIYQLDGDVLMSCTGGIDQDRPKTFETKPESGHTFRILRRIKDRTEAQSKADEEVIRQFTGAWTFSSVEAEGQPVPLEGFKAAKLKLEGDRFTMTDSVGTTRGIFWVDASASPKTLDVLFLEGPERGKVTRGIFRLEGDTYTSCLTLGDGSRPTEFVTKPSSRQILQVLKREKVGETKPGG